MIRLLILAAGLAAPLILPVGKSTDGESQPQTAVELLAPGYLTNPSLQSLSSSADQTVFVGFYHGGMVWRLSAEGGRTQELFATHRSRLVHAAISTEGSRAIALAAGGKILLQNVPGTQPVSLSAHESLGHPVIAEFLDDRHLAVVSKRNDRSQLAIIDVVDDRVVEAVKISGNPYRMSVAGTTRQFALVGNDGNIQCVSWQPGQPLETSLIPVHSDLLVQGVMSVDGTSVVCSDARGEAWFVDVETGEKLWHRNRQYGGRINTVIFLEDEMSRFITKDESGEVTLWNPGNSRDFYRLASTETKVVTACPHTSGGTICAFDKEGNRSRPEWVSRI